MRALSSNKIVFAFLQKVNNSIATKLCVKMINIRAIFLKQNSARHNSMTKLCYAFFKYENKPKNRLIKVTHSFEVHSNESACRKMVRLGLEQVKDSMRAIAKRLDYSIKGTLEICEEFYMVFLAEGIV